MNHQYNAQPMYAQQQQQQPMTQTQQPQYQTDGTALDPQRPASSTSIRRNSRVLSPQDRPNIGTIGQTLNDR